MKHFEVHVAKPLIYRDDLIEQNTVIAGQQKFSFESEFEARLLYEAIATFGPGEYVIPDRGPEAREALEDWLAHKEELNAWFRKRAENHSDDEDYIERMLKEYWNMYRLYRQGLEDPPAARSSPVHKIKVERSPNGEPAPIAFEPIPHSNRDPVTAESLGGVPN